jgi:hypothetical protein
MSQTLLTDAKITKETLMVLHNNLKFTQCAYRGYDKNFAVAGAKIGSVINIRLPNQYYVIFDTEPSVAHRHGVFNFGTDAFD